MIRKKIIKILSCLLLGVCLILPIKSVVSASVNYNTKIEYSVETKNAPKVLIIHSHTQEEYADDKTVVDIGEDLSKKLQALGVDVDHEIKDFSAMKGYDYSYHMSSEYLNSMEENYDLIIDLHRDWGANQNTVELFDVDVAKGMFVYSTGIDKYETNKEFGDEIKDNLYSQSVIKDDFTYINGIKNFNQTSDKGKSVLLLEAGNDKNDSWQVKRLMTYISKSIAESFNNQD